MLWPCLCRAHSQTCKMLITARYGEGHSRGAVEQSAGALTHGRSERPLEEGVSGGDTGKGNCDSAKEGIEKVLQKEEHKDPAVRDDCQETDTIPSPKTC